MKLIIIISLLFSLPAYAQIINASPPYKPIAVNTNLLLDSFSTAGAAFSMRKLRAAYSGNCIKVRRLSDNTLLDIGFVNNNLDTASLLTFVGASTARVTIWYDQSGNSRNVVEEITNSGPTIMVSGVISRVGTRPALLFGSASLIYPTGFLNSATALSYFHVGRIKEVAGSNAGVMGPYNTNTVGVQILQVSVASRPTYLSFNSSGAKNDNAGYPYKLWKNDTATVTTILGNATSTAAYRNGTAVTLTSSTAMPTLNYNGQYAIGKYSGSGNTMTAGSYMQEVVVYSTDKTSSHVAIETNMNNYYLVY